MNAMLRWSPTRHFHFHQDVNDVMASFIGGTTDATDEALQRPSWVPAAEGRLENGIYIIQISLPGVDPKDVKVSFMHNVLTVKGERKADHDTTDKDYFIREVAYGTFHRSFELPEGVDAAQVGARHANGILEVRVAAPVAATPRMIEVNAA
jgi:HSP20 family protein